MNRNSWRGRNTDTNAFNADAGSLYASLSCPMDAHPAPLPRPRLSLCTVCAPFFGWALFAGCLIEMFAGVATVQHGVAEKGGGGRGRVAEAPLAEGFVRHIKAFGIVGSLAFCFYGCHCTLQQCCRQPPPPPPPPPSSGLTLLSRQCVMYGRSVCGHAVDTRINMT